MQARSSWMRAVGLLTPGRGPSSILCVSPPQEKRKEPRVPIELRIDYRKLNTFFADYTKNISKGGTFIKTDKPLGVGTRFIFKFALPELEEPVELRGEVRWVRHPGDPASDDGNDSPGMGIQFDYDSEEQRRSFHDMVESMMRKSLGEDLADKLLGRS